jgi:hypothetical protein
MFTISVKNEKITMPVMFRRICDHRTEPLRQASVAATVRLVQFKQSGQKRLSLSFERRAFRTGVAGFEKPTTARKPRFKKTRQIGLQWGSERVSI